MTLSRFPVIIIAGGLATRLHPLTVTLPKALIEIRNEPFIFHQLRMLKAQGITDVVLSLGYLGEQVQALVGDGRQYGLSIQCVFDGPTLLGTAGALRNCLAYVDEPFFVMYGDSYLDCDFGAIQARYVQSGCLGLMTVFKNKGLWDRSNVVFDGQAIQVYDKRNQTVEMDHIDYGLGVLSRQAFGLPGAAALSDLADLYQLLLGAHQLAGFEVDKRFYEVGSFSGIHALNDLFCEVQKE